MTRSCDQLRRDALSIWQAGVDAVRSECLVRQAIRTDGSTLVLAEELLPLDAIGRIAVVGAGKAGAGMAAAVEESLGPRWLAAKEVTGWVNVPADCVRPLARIHLHPARPPGVNEPVPAGAEGTAAILRLVESLGPRDLCLCLISGGGSALLPAPVDGVTLEDKLAVTRHLSAAGANIEQLNTVRKQLSQIKGGGLARACRAGRLVALILSDVLGDPLEIIASGPTVEDTSTPQAALAVLDQFGAQAAGIAPRVFQYLARKAASSECAANAGREDRTDSSPRPAPSERADPYRVVNHIIGNNATAVDAAGREAVRRGYAPAMTSARRSEGLADDVGRHLAETALSMRHGSTAQSGALPDCLISGGEPVVRLADPSRRGLGGRNQQLVLAALQRLSEDGAEGIAVLSGGTDGEDGPTDAAGAILDASVMAGARRLGLNPADYLARNDAYHFFQPLDALLHTGPTHTNVCDVRVVVVT
jgi:hydroxypyruvate reductase